MNGTEPFWATTGGARYPDAPDPDDYYGQPYTRTKTHQDHIGIGFKWQLNDVFSVRSNLARRESEIELIAANNTLVPGAPGDYVVHYLLADQYESAGSAEFTVTR